MSKLLHFLRHHHLVEHAFVALVIAAAMSWIHHTHALNWVDAMSLRIVGQSEVDPSAAQTRPADPSMPVLVVIGHDAYESAFGHTSPLSRSVLKRVLESIASQCPKLIAVDLDLSPGASRDPGQAELDNYLAGMHQGSQCPQGPPRVLLVKPSPTATSAAQQANAQWMKRLCSSGVGFARAELIHAQGDLLQYAPGEASLGVVAAGFIKPGAGSVAPLAASQQFCQSVMQGAEQAIFLRLDGNEPAPAVASNFAKQLPLRSTFFEAAAVPIGPNAVIHPLSAAGVLGSPGASSAGAALAGRTVFLGGAYDPEDRFMTPYGQQLGVVVHAAIYHSQLQPVRSTTGSWFSFLLEWAMGLALSVLFEHSWRHYQRAKSALMARTEGQPWLLAYLKARAWLVGNFALPVLLFVLLVLVSAQVLRYGGIWVSPGPIILGVFLKSLLASREELHAHEAHLMPLPVRRTDAALGWMVVLGFVVVQLFGEH